MRHITIRANLAIFSLIRIEIINFVGVIYETSMSKKLTIVPHSGLANRMRAIAGAYVMAARSKRELEILWPVTRDCRAQLEVLFDMRPLHAQWSNTSPRQFRLHYQTPALCNGYISSIPRTWRKLVKGCVYINPEDLPGASEGHEQFENIELDIFRQAMSPAIRHLVITSAQEIGYAPPEIIRSIFRPSALVREMVEGKEWLMNPACHRIGVHVRRTDNKEAIRRSPLKDIVAVVKSEIQRASSPSMLYLATDDEKVKKMFRHEFANVVTSSQPATRKTVSGMLEAAAEMWMLSRCHVIIGSAASSYNVMASRIGDTPLITVER